MSKLEFMLSCNLGIWNDIERENEYIIKKPIPNQIYIFHTGVLIYTLDMSTKIHNNIWIEIEI